MANYTMRSNRRSNLVTLTTAALCLDDSTIVSTNVFSEGLRMKPCNKERVEERFECIKNDSHMMGMLQLSRMAKEWRETVLEDFKKGSLTFSQAQEANPFKEQLSELKKSKLPKDKHKFTLWKQAFTDLENQLKRAFDEVRAKCPFEILNFDGKSGSPKLQLKCSQKKLTIKDHGLREEFTEDAEAKGVEAPIWKKHHTELGSRQEWSNFREKYVEFSKTMYPTFLAIGQKRGNNIVEISADYEKHKLHKPETYEGMCLGSLQDTDTSRDGDEVEDDKKLKTAQTHNFNQILADLHRTPLPAKANAKKFTYVEAAKQFNISAFLLLNYHTPYGQGHNYFIAYWLRCMRLESRPDGNVDREAFVAWFLFCLVRQYPWAKCNADIQKLLMSEQAECLYPVWSTEVSRLGTAFCTFIVTDSTGRDTHEIHHDSPEGASLRFNVWEEILSKGKATYFYKLLKHILKNVVASEEVSFENVPKIKSKVQEHLADEANCKTALDTLEKESKLLFKAKQSVWKFFK